MRTNSKNKLLVNYKLLLYWIIGYWNYIKEQHLVNQQRAEEAKDQLRGQMEADPGSEFKLCLVIWLQNQRGDRRDKKTSFNFKELVELEVHSEDLKPNRRRRIAFWILKIDSKDVQQHCGRQRCQDCKEFRQQATRNLALTNNCLKYICENLVV